MSASGKTWQLKYERQAGESLWSALMNARAVEDPGAFFSSASLTDLNDPFLFPDMHRAVDRLQKAIPARERIIVYGDYDVDGISGSALLIHVLRFLGAEVSYRIPNRLKEGYGLHASYVEELAKQNAAVLITVDLGISCAKEVALAQSLSIDVIITDHHTIPEKLPEAFAILHPTLAKTYPFPHLSGSGVAFKLACALLIATKNEDLIPQLTDLASLGTVADCVPLIGENRTLVKLGLQQLQTTKWDGLRAILQNAGNSTFTTDTIGFQIGPRLNASGRMDNAYWGLQTLLATGPEAYEKSQKLEALNKDRQDLTKRIMEEAEAHLNLSEPLIIEAGLGWSSGIVGLIAGRLQEKYSKPTFVMEDRGDHLVGSARSLPGFHCVDALKTVAHLLEHFGGHEQAAGFHIKKENYEAFKTELQKNATAHFTKTPLVPSLSADLILAPDELTLEHSAKIDSFAPFGVGNPRPLFWLKDITVLETRPVGADGKHLKFKTRMGDQTIDGIAFNSAAWQADLEQATELLVHMSAKKWNDKISLEFQLVDCNGGTPSSHSSGRQ
jgi:single-stranded-DNA-specific exonuclease